MANKCETCKANKVCDHNKYGFENCGNYIPVDVVGIMDKEYKSTYKDKIANSLNELGGCDGLGQLINGFPQFLSHFAHFIIIYLFYTKRNKRGNPLTIRQMVRALGMVDLDLGLEVNREIAEFTSWLIEQPIKDKPEHTWFTADKIIDKYNEFMYLKAVRNEVQH